MRVTPPHPPAVEVVAFDPYAAALPIRWLRRLPSSALLLLAPIIAGVLVISAAIGGLLGSASDFQPVKDFVRAVGRSDLKLTDPFSYPLIRDTPVWFFAVIMVIEIAIMHRQWQLFARCLPKLVANNVIKPRTNDFTDDTDDPPILKWAVSFPPEQRLARYIDRVNVRNVQRAPLYTTVFALCALALAGLLIWAERYGLFRVLGPTEGTPAQQDQWRHEAYQHWWASTNHPVGAIAYYILVAIAIYVILVQTQVGAQIARIAAALPRLAQLDANWINPDGHYGWEPLRQIFRTVWITMALYGLMVSGLAVVLGLGSGGWVPAAFWFVLLCVYFLLPWLGIRRIETAARERHIAAALAEANPTSTREQDELEARVRRYRNARIRPMRLGNFARIPVLVGVLLPVVLNLIQPFIEIWLVK